MDPGADTVSRGADAAYREALLERLARRDPIDVLAGVFEWLPDEIAGLDEAELRAPEREGKWSILDVIQHMADTELVQGWRIRRILTEEEPALHGIDQDAWAADLRYESATLQGSLDQLRALRAANLRLVRSLPDSALERAGIHAERGRETLATTLALVAGHDLVHRDQIRRIRRAVTSAAGTPSGLGGGTAREDG